jgi:hypothetical protein
MREEEVVVQPDVEATQDVLAEAAKAREELTGRYRETVEAYRDLLRVAHQDAVPEMIGGESVEELNKSLEAAKAAFARAKEQALKDLAGAAVSSGGERSAPDASSLSPVSKIAWGLKSSH